MAAATVLVGNCAATTESRDTPTVLFIGNSLTYVNDLPGIVAALIDSAGVGPARVASVTFPGVGLEDHYTGGPAREVIARDGWDVVVMQQGPSATEGRPSLLEFSRRFAEDIRAVGGRPALYMVWPEEARSFDFAGVSASYRMAADSVDGLLFPAGEAWLEAWRRDPQLQLYGPDRFHPSQAGSYLAALVMVQQLTGRSPLGLPAALVTPAPNAVEIRIDPGIAAILQASAAEANRRFARR